MKDKNTNDLSLYSGILTQMTADTNSKKPIELNGLTHLLAKRFVKTRIYWMAKYSVVFIMVHFSTMRKYESNGLLVQKLTKCQ